MSEEPLINRFLNLAAIHDQDLYRDGYNAVRDYRNGEKADKVLGLNKSSQIKQRDKHLRMAANLANRSGGISAQAESLGRHIDRFKKSRSARWSSPPDVSRLSEIERELYRASCCCELPTSRRQLITICSNQ